jgi:hypothetical protein
MLGLVTPLNTSQVRVACDSQQDFYNDFIINGKPLRYRSMMCINLPKEYNQCLCRANKDIS